jgi:hypothetical protein
MTVQQNFCSKYVFMRPVCTFILRTNIKAKFTGDNLTFAAEAIIHDREMLLTFSLLHIFLYATPCIRTFRIYPLLFSSLMHFPVVGQNLDLFSELWALFL